MAAVVQYGYVLYRLQSCPRPEDAIAYSSKIHSKDGGGRSKPAAAAADWDPGHVRRVDKAAFVGFPAATVVLAAIYWIYFLQK